jgi:SAM-dependent methyltransferase
MTTSTGAHHQRAWNEILDHACAPYRSAGRFAWHFARGKLSRDPVFQTMLARGDLPAQARVTDIGCGQGLLASLLQACAAQQQRGGWPPVWPTAPRAVAYTGIELMPRDVARAERALAGTALQPRFVCADMCHAPLPASDVVVILDVLHYVDHAAQHALLQRVRDALQPAGRLLLRVGDAERRGGFLISQWVDRIVTNIRGHRAPPTWGRPLREWQQLLHTLGFQQVDSVPMSRGTPFANVLLRAQVGHASAQPSGVAPT